MHTEDGRHVESFGPPGLLAVVHGVPEQTRVEQLRMWGKADPEAAMMQQQLVHAGHVDLVWAPAEAFGLGLNGLANLNGRQSFAALTVAVHLGGVR